MKQAGNRIDNRADSFHVNCEESRTLLSARIDGSLADAPGLDGHLAGCPACRDWEDRAHALARRGLGAAEMPPQVDTRVRPRRALVLRVLRIALGWTGFVLVVWGFPGVLDPSAEAAIVHLARHQYAFEVALGLAFLFVAWRPDRAYGLVPFAATLAAALGFSAIVDLADGSSTTTAEARHVVELIGLAILVALGVSAGPGRRRTAKARLREAETASTRAEAAGS